MFKWEAHKKFNSAEEAIRLAHNRLLEGNISACHSIIFTYMSEIILTEQIELIEDYINKFYIAKED